MSLDLFLPLHFVGLRALRAFVVPSSSLCVLCVSVALWLSPFFARSARAADVTLPITADNSICAYPAEQSDNMGASPRIKMKGIENILILNFDATPIRSCLITRATLHIRGTEKNMMVRKVGLSTIATDWSEGRQASEAKGGKGDSTFLSPDGTDRPWAGPGGTFLAVVWGRGGTLWSQTFTKPDADQWYDIDIDPRLIEACAARLSCGLAVSDDNGQTMSVIKEIDPATNQSNNHFYAREQANAAPRLIIQMVSGAAMGAPLPPVQLANVEVKPWDAGSDFTAGGLEIAFPGPKTADEARATLGYRIQVASNDGPLVDLPRWQHPAPPPPGERVRALLKNQPPNAKVRVHIDVIGRAWAVIALADAAGQSGPALSLPPALVLERPATAPAAPAADPPAIPHARVFAIPDLAKANPITGNVLEDPAGPGKYEADSAAGGYRSANPAWSAMDRTIHLAGVRGEWVAAQIVCENTTDKPQPVEFKVTPADLTAATNDERVIKISRSAFTLSRAWYQHVGKSDRAWYADPLIPLGPGAPFSVPDPRNAIAHQTNQTVYLELFIPKDALPCVYQGPLVVVADNVALPLHIQLEVAPARIPDAAHFVFSMNAYESPGRAFGNAAAPEFLAAERAFYTMAHLHRTTLAILHYSHAGDYAPGAALPLAGSGKAMHIADWSAWDQRFGPLLDGSAFKGTPRELPIDHFYLTMAEHYPTPMDKGYKWNNVAWEDHWKMAGPIEEGFSQEYQDAWSAVAADMMRHFAAQHYGTKFQVYLNDKYYYKQYDPKRKGPGRGVSFWLLDEPVHIDDFAALNFFGRLFRNAQALAGAEAARTTLFRADISRPEWGRDTLDRTVDLNVSGALRDHRDLLEDFQARHNQTLWTYGSTPPSTQSAYAIDAQALDLFSRGVDGYVPWLVLGSEENWTTFAQTCVIYSGKPVGITGPVASLRLKAFRRGEQDVEILRLYAERKNLFDHDPNRLRLAKILSAAIPSSRAASALDSQGAVVETLTDLHPEDFAALRAALVPLLANKTAGN